MAKITTERRDTFYIRNKYIDIDSLLYYQWTIYIQQQPIIYTNHNYILELMCACFFLNKYKQKLNSLKIEVRKKEEEDARNEI